MFNGKVVTGTILEICRSRSKRGPMESVQEAMAYAGRGLEDDRYAIGEGSYQHGKIGRRQMTLMHRRAFELVGGYSFIHTRRNVLIDGDEIELAWLLGKQEKFKLGDAVVRAVGYCDPCDVPTRMVGLSPDRPDAFKRLFKELGGIILEVLEDGRLSVGGPVIARHKGYE